MDKKILLQIYDDKGRKVVTLKAIDNADDIPPRKIWSVMRATFYNYIKDVRGDGYYECRMMFLSPDKEGLEYTKVDLGMHTYEYWPMSIRIMTKIFESRGSKIIGLYDT